ERLAVVVLPEQRTHPLGAVKLALVAHALGREDAPGQADRLGAVGEGDRPGSAGGGEGRLGGLVDVVPDGDEEVERLGGIGEHLLVGVPVAPHVVLAVGDREAHLDVGAGCGSGAGPAGLRAVAGRAGEVAEAVVVGGGRGEALEADLGASAVGRSGGGALPVPTGGGEAGGG